MTTLLQKMEAERDRIKRDLVNAASMHTRLDGEVDIRRELAFLEKWIAAAKEPT